MIRKSSKYKSHDGSKFSFEAKLEIITKYCFGVLFAALSIILILFSVNFAISQMSIDSDINIIITGNKILTTVELEENLLKMIDQDKLTSTRKLQQTLESLAWIRKAEVKNNYGRSLVVNITEKEPVVIANFLNQNYFLDSKATIITKARGIDPNLLYVKGKPNKEQLSSILTIAKLINNSHFNMDSLEILKNKRFEVILSNQTKIKLSQASIEEELTKLSVILSDSFFIRKLMPRIAVIDLRYNKAISLKFKSDLLAQGHLS